MVVVYKIDRLSRSLADFIRLLDVLGKYGVGFVSVTQTVDTSESMGRLVLNILLNFAQFERELASERIREESGLRGSMEGQLEGCEHIYMSDRQCFVRPYAEKSVRTSDNVPSFT